MDSAIFIATLGLFGTIVAGLFKIIDNQTKALKALTDSNEKIASATNKAAQEAEKRNGHLAELAIENHKSSMKALKQLNKK